MLVEERAQAKEAKVTQGKAGATIATTKHQHHNALNNLTGHNPIEDLV